VALKRAERPCTFKLDGVIAGFANIEHITNPAQETGQFLRELSVLLGSLGKVQQFLADQVIQCARDPEVAFDAPRGRALFDPYPFEMNL
jgi:hypothetical protein